MNKKGKEERRNTSPRLKSVPNTRSARFEEMGEGGNSLHLKGDSLVIRKRRIKGRRDGTRER